MALLAHPGRCSEIRDYPLDVLRELLDEVPLDGIQVYYPLHSAAQVADYERLAHELGVLVSAGSDAHGLQQRLPVAYEPAQVAAQVAPLLGRVEIPVNRMEAR